MYIYEGHMGSLYTSDYPLEYEDLYCEQCGDSDWLVGFAITSMYEHLLMEIGMSKGNIKWDYYYSDMSMKCKDFRRYDEYNNQF